MCHHTPCAVEQEQLPTPPTGAAVNLLLGEGVEDEALMAARASLGRQVGGIQGYDPLSADVEEPVVEEVQSKQRKTVRLYPLGSLVEIYSDSQQRWIADGEVVEVAWESGTRDGTKVSAGSTKLIYDLGRRFKWVASHRLRAMVRESQRPFPPASWTGHLVLDTYTGLLGHWSTWVYVEVCGGVLRWSPDLEQPQAAKRSSADTSQEIAFDLLGMRIEKAGMHVSVRTDGTRFQAPSTEIADAFTAALRVHAQYCAKDESIVSTFAKSSTVDSARKVIA